MDKSRITTSNKYIEDELSGRLIELAKVLDGDVITIFAPMMFGVDDLVRNVIEGLSDGRRDDLYVVLETPGGSIEIVERIADTFRHHYGSGEVSFIVPNSAMSAGTVLCMSGDRIYMDYYSILGPIDPQVFRNATGAYVPALGYLDKFDEFVEKSQAGQLSAAEITFLVQNFDPAELDQFKKARELSVSLLERWLVEYKFKDWEKTDERGLDVTPEMKEERAREIGEALNNTGRWKTHSRGISKDILVNELKLMVEDFGQRDDLNSAIRSYYRLLQDYMLRRNKQSVVHSRTGLVMMGGQ